ncbi:MAG TPA: YebC/PmpR family DNA-binding transcriptional regulator [Dehalococcoidia bacterium]|nr:YebC/PmpR family DNA-binding transcriptional regulator [Dehalococcoidia bacterium]
MSGHSKWSTIKRQKGAADAKRGALFTRLSREIIIAARAGGGDPNSNFKLRLAVQRAKSSNMPNDNIDRAISRAVGGGDADNLEETTYEGYSPGGTAILVDVATDNRNRTVAEVRHCFTRAGGNLGESGSVAWQFEAKGVLTIHVDPETAEDIALQAIDAGADDVEPQGDMLEVRTEPGSLEEVRHILESAGLRIENADFAMVPKTPIELDEKSAKAVLRLLDDLEELEDVQRVFSNGDFPDEVLAGLEA